MDGGNFATGGNGTAGVCVKLEFTFRPVSKTTATTTTSFNMSSHLSVSTYQSDPERAGIREICYLRFLLKCSYVLILLKSNRTLTYFYDLSRLSGFIIDAGCVLCEVSVETEETVSRRSLRRKQRRRGKR